jgi:hypothetical protein
MNNHKIIIQAHRLRSAAATSALLHGSAEARAQHGLLGPLRGSLLLTGIIVIAVLVTTWIIGLLPQTGH